MILESCREVLRNSGFKFRDDWASVITGMISFILHFRAFLCDHIVQQLCSLIDECSFVVVLLSRVLILT